MIKRAECRVPSVEMNRRARVVFSAHSRHPSRVTRHACRAEAERRRAFTLVELLTVIAIIGILAAILLPTLAAAKRQAKVKQAQLQISELVTAIQNYDSAYSRMPVSKPVEDLVNNNPAAFGGQFTYGGFVFETNIVQGKLPASDSVYTTNNSEVIAILMDVTNYPDGSGPTANVNHQKNPQEHVYLNAKPVTRANLPGVGPDLVYRDPWGNPYVISIDLNEDHQCKDAFYCLNKVSGSNQTKNNPGLNGLTNPDSSKDDNFRYHGNVMVWSAGPDKKADPALPADQGFNDDNVLSWQ